MGSSARFDPIAVVEAAYRLDGGMEEWLDGLAETVRPELDRGYGVQAVAYDWATANMTPSALAVRGTPPGMEKFLREINDHAPPGEAAVILKSPSRLYSYREIAGPGQEDFFESHPLGDLPPFRDWVATLVWEPGVSLLVGGFSPTPVVLSAEKRRRWHRLSVHIAAGLRLALGLAKAPQEAPEAILEPDGRCAHAEGEAPTRSARDALRAAAKRIDRARGPMRRTDRMGALAPWRGLCDGRWSLLDRFESDGRRYVVALRNEPSYRDPRALTPRQRHVAHLVSMGFSNGEIAYSMGLSESAVASHVSAVLRKLDLRRREELPEALSTEDTRTTTATLEEQTIAVASKPVGVDVRIHGLTPAEGEVVSGVIDGLSDREIAAGRGVAVRTVSNQLRSAFRKLGVRSRAELVARVHGSAQQGRIWTN